LITARNLPRRDIRLWLRHCQGRFGGRREGDHRVASPGRGIYAGVLEGMAKSFAAELRPVRVNGVCAGAVDTELWHRLPEAERLATFARIGTRLPASRVGRPEDTPKPI
jgi:NAD(P)-dependent dehydrogenase (short-subunit alcohol dehydrogenase family)